MADATPHPSNSSRRVQFFPTCLVNDFLPEAGIAAVELLERAGIEVERPRGLTCCGQPAYNAGFRAEAKRVARRTFELLARTDGPIVVPSGSCADMLVHQGEELFRDDEALSPSSDASRNAPTFVMMYHGTLTSIYGLDIALEAFALVHTDMPGAQFWILGRGPEEPALRQRCMDYEYPFTEGGRYVLPYPNRSWACLAISPVHVDICLCQRQLYIYPCHGSRLEGCRSALRPNRDR
jgi:glycosyltransferase involved in cell wall biosynthesis